MSHFHFQDGDGFKSTQKGTVVESVSVDDTHASGMVSNDTPDVVSYDAYDDMIYNDYQDGPDPPEDIVKDEDTTQPLAGIVFKKAERCYEKSVKYISFYSSTISHIKLGFPDSLLAGELLSSLP
jgi:hypothetical protein